MLTVLFINTISFYLFLRCFINIHKRIPSKIYWLICFFLIIIVAFRGPIDQDYGSYVETLNDSNSYTISEPTFILFRWIVNLFSLPNVTLFLIYAFCGISLKFIAIRKYSELEIVSLLIYFSNILLLHDITQIRAGVASALLLLSLDYLYHKKYKQYIFIILIATLFHYSSLGAILLLLISSSSLKKKKHIYIWGIIPVLGLFFHLTNNYFNAISLIPIESIRIKMEMYKALEEKGVEGFSQVNLFNPYFIFKLCIFYFLFFYRKYFSSYPKFIFYLKIFGISLFLFHSLSAITPLLGYRMSEYVGVIEIFLIPYCFLLFKTKKQKFLMISAYYILLASINIFYKKLIII